VRISWSFNFRLIEWNFYRRWTPLPNYRPKLPTIWTFIGYPFVFTSIPPSASLQIGVVSNTKRWRLRTADRLSSLTRRIPRTLMASLVYRKCLCQRALLPAGIGTRSFTRSQAHTFPLTFLVFVHSPSYSQHFSDRRAAQRDGQSGMTTERSRAVIAAELTFLPSTSVTNICHEYQHSSQISISKFAHSQALTIPTAVRII